MGGSANLVGRILAKLRYERGWTQDYLASRLHNKARYAATRDAVANFETGRAPVTDKVLAAYVKACNVGIEVLFPVEFRTPDGKGVIVGMDKEPHTRRRRRKTKPGKKRRISASR